VCIGGFVVCVDGDMTATRLGWNEELEQDKGDCDDVSIYG
jgi:hypothetical protein